MERIKALSLSIGQIQEPVIASYRLGLILHRLYKTKAYEGEELRRLEKTHATAVEFRKAVTELLEIGVLEEHPDFKGRVFRLLGRKIGSPQEIACAVDPFCYVSHLSAMDYHGLTNRMPVKLFLSGPSQKHWKEEAQKLMQRDLGEDSRIYRQEGMPALSPLKLNRIGRTDVHLINSLRWGSYKKVRDTGIRVSTIGRTFLDMLRDPEYCGGIHHVIEVFLDHAKNYLQAIVNEIDQHGKAIDKVRAGYILEERMQINNPVVDSWTKYAKRGGSRKLDAKAEYMPNWSEKWCLSLNT